MLTVEYVPRGTIPEDQAQRLHRQFEIPEDTHSKRDCTRRPPCIHLLRLWGNDKDTRAELGESGAEFFDETANAGDSLE